MDEESLNRMMKGVEQYFEELDERLDNGEIVRRAGLYRIGGTGDCYELRRENGIDYKRVSTTEEWIPIDSGGRELEKIVE